VEDQNCDIAEGHLSASLCHLANISYRLGVETPIGQAEGVYTDKNVNDFVVGMLTHLKANQVDVEKSKGRFGPTLLIDVKAERINGLGPISKSANAMLFGEYRKGFELKEIA
jgi:hypothetical protein